MFSISANNAHTPFLPLTDIQQQPYRQHSSCPQNPSFLLPAPQDLGCLNYIHWPWRSLQSFVKQNTPFVSQQERKEWSNTKPWRDLEGWVCSEAQAFWLPIVQLCQQKKTNITTTLCHHLGKNAPHHMTLQINTSYRAVYFLGFEKLHPSRKVDF